MSNYEGFLLFCFTRSKVLPSFDIHHSLFDIRYSKNIPNTISKLNLGLSICSIFSLKSLKQRLIHCSFIACQMDERTFKE